MSLRTLGLLCSCASLIILTATFSSAQVGESEPGLIADWAPASAKIEGQHLIDGTRKVRAKIIGKPTQEKIGPADCTSFDGASSWISVAEDIGSAEGRNGLPNREFTVAAWVTLAETSEYGGITGAIQDNGDYEKGWMLGYTHDAFYLALSTKGADDGNGKLAYLKSATTLKTGLWYYVVGTYDGATMRLYVNGKLDGESKQQSGDILYPKSAPYVIGGYIDDDEKHLMYGSLVDIKVYSRVLSVDAITQQVAAGAALVSWRPPSNAEQGFLVKPYLQFATTDSMRILWETKKSSACTVSYGKQLPMTLTVESTPSQTMHEVVLTGLDAATQYLYRVSINDSGGAKMETEILSFQTAVLPDSPFAFVVIGDTQRNPPVIAKLQKMAYSLRPNFEIHCGDVVDTGPDKNEWVNEMLAESNVLMSRVPLYPTLGNHEKNHSHYYQYFSLPSPEYYYTYTYGNAQFFVLDSNKEVGPGTEQWKWLDEQLGKSKAKWKFCYHHHPVYTSDENDYGDTYKGTSFWGEKRVRPLAELYEKHAVDIVFQGHIHVYERSWPIRAGKVVEDGGVIYLTSGGGGGGLEAAAPSRTWFQKRHYGGHHICYVTINGGSLELQAFDLEGRMFDQMELKKK